LAEGLQRKFSRLAVVELPAPRALEGRRREVRAAQRAILWVPSLRSTRTSEWTFWTFLGLFRCVSLLESGPFRGPCWVVAARACLVPSARRGGRLLPRGGACAGAGRRALWLLLLVPFFGRNAGAALRAPVPWRVQGRVRGPAGGCLPFRSRWLSRAAAGAATARRSRSADSNDHIGCLGQHAGEARRVPEHLCRWRAQGARAARRGGCLPCRSRWLSRLGQVPPQCAQVRCGAAFVGSTFLVGTLARLSERLCRGGCRSACAARRGGCLPFRSRWLSRPAAGAATARRACAERSTVWWNCARVSWEFCGSSPACS